MSPNGQRVPLVYTLVCLALAAVDLTYKNVSATFLALVFMGLMPWILPWLSTQLKTLKVGALELAFKDLQAQVDETKKAVEATTTALATGVGKDPAAAPAAPAPVKVKQTSATGGGPVSFSVPLGRSDDNDTDDEVETISADPNKGKFGGKPEANGRKLTAQVKALPGNADLFLIHATVFATDLSRKLTDGEIVTFYLHPTFRQASVPVPVEDGAASLDRIAWGAFTIGAELSGGTRLELDLSTDVPSAPALFRSR